MACQRGQNAAIEKEKKNYIGTRCNSLDPYICSPVNIKMPMDSQEAWRPHPLNMIIHATSTAILVTLWSLPALAAVFQHSLLDSPSRPIYGPRSPVTVKGSNVLE